MEQKSSVPEPEGTWEAVWARGLTRDVISEKSTAPSFARGEEYCRDDSVISLVRRGNTLYAEVEGSADEPYEVSASVEPNGRIAAECDCAYSYGGWCKHIVAALLCALEDPGQVEERPTLETLLAPLDQDTLRAVLLAVVEEEPRLMEAVEDEIARLVTEPAAAAPAPPAPVDPKAVRKEVRHVLNGVAQMDWRLNELAGEEMEEGIRDILEVAVQQIEAGDGRGALPRLEAVTDELVDGWDRVEDMVGDASDLFDEIGRLWAEALLTADLAPEERRTWAAALRKWQEDGSGMGADSGLDVAVEATKQGWDYPPLVRVLQGVITDKGVWDGESPDYADDLAVARLNVLERQGRLQEAAYLAEAEGQFERYLDLLVRLGRAEEAAELARTHLTKPDAILGLARTLHAQGEAALALRIATHGLGLEGSIRPLAIWLRDTALAVGDTDRAIMAAMAALSASPSLEDYLLLQKFSGERWLQIRDDALAAVKSGEGYSPTGRVDILLHEGLIDDALDLVEGRPWDYTNAARVVDAATATRPHRVIPICKAQAEEIMDAGKSDRYHHAVRWLERARDAYRVAGEDEEWRNYKEQLLADHARKYKLAPMIKAL